MGEAANTLLITVQSVISALVVYVAGFLLVKFRKIDASTVVGLSSVVNNCLLPSLLFIRLGSQLSDEVISYAYSLFLLNIGITVATFLFSNFILIPIAQPSRSFVPWFNLGQVVPNEFSLPLLFVTSVCKEVKVAVPEFFEDEHAADASGGGHRLLQDEEYEPTLTEHECIEIAELYVFLYALPLTLALFTLGPIYLSRFRAIPPTIEVIKESQNPLSMMSHFEDLQPLSRIESGRARSRPGQTNYSKPLSFFSTRHSKAGSQLNSKDQVNSRMDELVLNESRDDDKPVSQLDRDFEPAVSIGGHDNNPWAWLHPLMELFYDPPAVALLLGLIVGLIPQVQDFLFEDGPFHSLTDGLAVLGGGTSSGLNLIMACTLALKLFALENKWDAFGNEQRVGISRRTLFVYAGAKMILMPIIWFGSLQALYPVSVPDDALLKFAVNLIVMMPTSTLLVMLAQVTGDMVSAEILAIAALLQFIIGLVTITVLMFMSLLSLDMVV